jgi:alpha-mannosidase
MTTFANVQSPGRGLAIVTSSGLHECELLAKKRTMALTLLHSTQKTVGTLGVEGGQLLQTLIYELRILPHDGNWQEARIPEKADAFNCPPWAQQLKLGSTPAPSAKPLLTATASSLPMLISAYKLADEENTIITRMWEPYGRTTQFHLEFPNSIQNCSLAKLSEEKEIPNAGHILTGKIQPHQILTAAGGLT